jgi:hypothetical protein
MMNIWVAAISAVAALSGVVLGQWLQARRELVQYSRDRDREELQWRRENQQRFAQEKRKTYADFLATLEKCERCIDHIDEAQDREPAPLESRLGDRHPPYITKQHDGEYEAIYRKIGDGRSQTVSAPV